MNECDSEAEQPLEKVEYLRLYSIVYYQGRWVGIPLFFVPQSAYDSASGEVSYFRLEILEGDPLPEAQRRDYSAALKAKSDNIRESLVPWLLSEEDLKEVCAKNDIPLSWASNRFVKKVPEKKSNTLRRRDDKERKNKPLTIEEYRALRKALRKISQQSALICEILWYVNTVFKNGGAYITLEEIIRLQVKNIAPDNGKNSVSFSRDIPTGFHLLTTYLPLRLWKSLCLWIKEDSIFVFSTRDGGPLSTNQINKHIKAAAKKAGISRDITSLSFRPSSSAEVVEGAKRSHVDASVKRHLEPVLDEEWEQICCEFPFLRAKRGRKPIHNQRMILNVILQSRRERRSLKKCLPPLLPEEAVKSQLRRWKQSGVLDEIFAFRKSLPPS